MASHHPESSVPSINLPLLSVASALLAAAVGVSYVYVDLALNRMGVSATAIGINAAMPALAWLLATPMMPWALRRFPAKGLLMALLGVAAAAILCFPVWPDATWWLGLRFLFGGATGMVFRLVEYWINVASPDTHRARNVGIYVMAFATGALVGGVATPAVGVEGWPPIVMIAVLVCVSAVVFAILRGGPPGIKAVAGLGLRRLCRGGAFVALSGILVYGMFEGVPYTLMPVYVVRLGLADQWALWCAAAAIGGQIIMAVPAGILADRHGKGKVAALSAACALVVPAVIPTALAVPELLLVAMALWGGFAGSLYNVTLAMLADRFQGAELASANAAFGTLYALGSLAGPPLHGLAMDAWNPQGLMLSAAGVFGCFLVAAAWGRSKPAQASASVPGPGDPGPYAQSRQP
ncbi:MAG: MFS transporter [Magnetospirillum sp.]|nr:MFS transporter [Magnetospirillum sp.]